MVIASQVRVSDHPIVVALGTKRAAVWATHQYRMDTAHSRALYNQAGEAWDTVAHAYQMAVAATIADEPREMLAESRADLETRLTAGVRVLIETPEVAAHFSRLLWRYEAVCDVQAGIKSVADWLARLDHRAGLELQWKQGYGKQE